MKKDLEIKNAFERNEQVLLSHPELGSTTGKIKVNLKEGLCCQMDNGTWQFSADMSRKMGGNQSAPSPSVYVAGALGSCIAIMTKMWAAKLNIPINRLEIEVTYETDRSMLFGLNDVPAHWGSISYLVQIESPASETELLKVLNLAHKHSPIRGDLEHNFQIERTVILNNATTF